MLSLSLDSIEEMRTMLLAAVMTDGLQGEEREHAVMAAEHLKHLAVAIESEGSNFCPITLSTLGDLLEHAIKQNPALFP